MNFEQRLSQVLGRKVNLAHEPMMEILKELLTILEQYQTEYQDTVKAVRQHLVEGNHGK
jgi:ribosomal protein L5